MKLFLWICILCSGACSSGIKVNEFTVVSELMDKTEKKEKPALIYLSMPDCPICELFDYKIMVNKKVQNYINRHFLFYKIDITRNTYFPRILHFYGAPLLIILEGKEIKGIISGVNDSEALLFSLNNFRMMPLESTISAHTSLKGFGKDICNHINRLLNITCHFEKKDVPDEEIRNMLVRSVEAYPVFYNRYLLAKMLEKSSEKDSEKMLSVLADEYTDPITMMLFASELQEILNKRFHIGAGDKSDIRFDQMKYDFGEVRLGEVVSHKFYYKNVSSVPLLIYSVNSSCGCTIPVWSQHPVLNGKVDSLEVVFTASSVGANTKTVNVITNGLKRNSVLTIKAVVK